MMPAKSAKKAPAPKQPLVTLEEVMAALDESTAEFAARPRELTKAEQDREMARCKADVVYFIKKYVYIYDNVSTAWILFNLWPEQERVLRDTDKQKYVIEPKARQNGASWKAVARALWKMRFLPIREVLLFSQRDDEAMKLLQRLHGIYDRLPVWMQGGIVTDSAHELQLLNGSRIQALPASAGGRSNAATDVIIDEADFIPDLAMLVSNARPTIDAGEGQMTILSTVNEETPNSYFQQLCKLASTGDSPWFLSFLGWQANPNRTSDWYENLKRETLLTYGTLDPLYKHYPATLTEALAPRELNKRFPPDWILRLSAVRKPLNAPATAPAIPGLRLYKLPVPGRIYGIGSDPGGGKHDNSVSHVIDAESMEFVATLSGKVEPTQFANYTVDLSHYYNDAPILFELNNHGHAFLAQCKERGATLRRGLNRRGVSDREPGWLTTERSKHMLYDTMAKVMQQLLIEAEAAQQPAYPIFFDQQTIIELTSIDVNSLEAPEGLFDDHAMAAVLSTMCVYRGASNMVQSRHDLWTQHETVAAVPIQGKPKVPRDSVWGQPVQIEPAAYERLKARGIIK